MFRDPDLLAILRREADAEERLWRSRDRSSTSRTRWLAAGHLADFLERIEEMESRPEAPARRAG